MSKTKKITVELPVETVENWAKMLDYCTSTLMFWKLDNKWPTNLIYEGLSDTLNEIKYNLPTRSTFDTELPF